MAGAGAFPNGRRRTITRRATAGNAYSPVGYIYRTVRPVIREFRLSLAFPCHQRRLTRMAARMQANRMMVTHW